MFTNGKYELPIDNKIQTSKEVAQELIVRFNATVVIKLVTMDGLYCHVNAYNTVFLKSA